MGIDLVKVVSSCLYTGLAHAEYDLLNAKGEQYKVENYKNYR